MTATFQELTDEKHARLMALLLDRAARHERVATYYGTDNCPHDDKTVEHDRHFMSWAGVACLDQPAGDDGCGECEQEECENSNAFYWAREDFWSLMTAEGIGLIREDWARSAIAADEQERGLDTDPEKLNVHGAEDCAGDRCIIHRPSAHPLVNARMVWRGLLGMARLCSHGKEHPDRDDVAFRLAFMPEEMFEHDCDGCCIHVNEQTA